MSKHPDFPQWLETETGKDCNDIDSLSEQRFLTNRLSWAFDAGRNCVWDQYIEIKAERNTLQDENNKLRELLIEAADHIAKHPAERLITTGERIVTEVRKLLNL